jgi:hypothetical protein
LPALLLCYFLPSLLNTFNIIDDLAWGNRPTSLPIIAGNFSFATKVRPPVMTLSCSPRFDPQAEEQ